MLHLLNHLQVFHLRIPFFSFSPQSIPTALSVQAQWWLLLQWLERRRYWYPHLRADLTSLPHGPNLPVQIRFSCQTRDYLPYTPNSGSASHPAVHANPSVNYITLHYPNPFWDFSYIFGVFKSHALGSPDDLKVYNNHVCLGVSDLDVRSIRYKKLWQFHFPNLQNR